MESLDDFEYYEAGNDTKMDPESLDGFEYYEARNDTKVALIAILFFQALIADTDTLLESKKLLNHYPFRPSRVRLPKPFTAIQLHC